MTKAIKDILTFFSLCVETDTFLLYFRVVYEYWINVVNMHFIEFNIRYEISDGAAVYMCYHLRDNGNVVDGTLPLREVQKGWWQCTIEADDRLDRKSVV